MRGGRADILQEIEPAVKGGLNLILYGESGVGKDYLARVIHQKRKWEGELMVYDCEQTVRDQTRIVGQLTSPIFFQKLRRSARKNTVFVRRVDLLQAHLLAQLSDFLVELGKRGAVPRNELLNLGLIGSLQTSNHSRPLHNFQLQRFSSILFCLKMTIPPLRQRKREIPGLAETFISQFNKEQKRKVVGILPDVLGLLLQFDWPDNICELRMEIERAATFTRDYEPIEPSALSEKLIKSIPKSCLLH